MAQSGRRLDERPAGIAIAVHPFAIRQAGRLGETGRGRCTGVGDGHDQVGIDRVLEGELHPHPATGFVQVSALHVRIGPCEVDEFEDTQGRRRLGESHGAGRMAGLEDDHLAWQHVADVLGADDIEGCGLRRQAPAGRRLIASPDPVVRVVRRRESAEDERAEPERITNPDDPALVEHDKAVGAPDPRQHALECLHRVARGLIGEQRGQQLRVGRGGESCAAAVQLLEQLPGVDQIAVVSDGKRPARAEAVGRLGVLPDRRAGRRVAAVRDGQLTPQARQPTLIEDRADHPEILVQHQLVPVADRQAGRFLAAMLEREQPERRDRRGLGRLTTGQDHPEHAAHRSALPAERTGQAVLPCVAQIGERDLERVGDPATAFLGGTGRARRRRAR